MAIGATHCLREKEFSFLLDSTTRPSDLPLNVIVESQSIHTLPLECVAPTDGGGGVWRMGFC